MSLKKHFFTFLILTVLLYSKEVDYKILNFNKKKFFNLSLLIKNKKIEINISKNKTLYELYKINFLNSKKCTIIDNFLICSFKRKKNFFIILNFKKENHYYSKVFYIVYNNIKNLKKKNKLLNKVNTYISSTNYIPFTTLINIKTSFVNKKLLDKKFKKILFINNKNNLELFKTSFFLRNEQIFNFININISFLNKLYLSQINSLKEKAKIIDIIKSNF